MKRRPPTIDEYLESVPALARDLGRYGQTKSSLHFSPANPLPIALVRKLVNTRVKEAKA